MTRNPYTTLGGKRGDLLGFASAKTIKGESLGYRTAIMYLVPHTLSGSPSLCPYSTPGCRSVCLNLSGRGAFSRTQAARLNKTMFWRKDKAAFIDTLGHEIEAFLRSKEVRAGMRPCVRLNGTSDIMWEREAPVLFRTFSNLQFYDYTKIPLQYRRPRPDNYYLTFSLAETPASVAASQQVLSSGQANVAVPIVLSKRDPMPSSWGGSLFGRAFPVVDPGHGSGDYHDLRFLDRPRGGAVVLLRLKRTPGKREHLGFAHAATNPPGRAVEAQRGGGMTNGNPALLHLLYGRH